MQSEPIYLTIARRDIGVREIKGPKHHTRITQMLAKLGAWWRDDETPWCGVALAAWMQAAGYPIPKQYYRALAWANYGVGAPGPRQGAIAVLTRNGGGHVGIVTGVTANGSHVRLLGGNQNDGVNEAWFLDDRVTAYRFPSSIARVSPPVTAVLGSLSRSEA